MHLTKGGEDVLCVSVPLLQAVAIRSTRDTLRFRIRLPELGMGHISGWDARVGGYTRVGGCTSGWMHEWVDARVSGRIRVMYEPNRGFATTNSSIGLLVG